MRKCLYFCLFFIYTWCNIYSQNPKWVVYQSSNYVTSIANENSYEWIGTTYGLVKQNKLDGSKTNYFKTNSNLPGNHIYSIAIDSFGNKWIGTDAGLAKFDGTNFIVYTSSNSGIPNNTITAVAVDLYGSIWAGTIKGLAKFDGSKWSAYTYKNNYFDYNVTALVVDSQNRVFVGTDLQLIMIDGATVTGLLTYCINSISIDPSGIKWIATNGGLIKYDDNSYTVYNTGNSKLPDIKLTSVAADSSGNVWVGLAYYGLFKFDGTNWTTYTSSNSGLPSNYISAVSVDTSGNKWIGTSGCGLTKFDDRAWTPYNMSADGMPNNTIYAVAIDSSGSKWIGTDSGVGKLTGSTWTVYNTANSKLPNNIINSISVDVYDNVWVGTIGGMAEFDGSSWNAYTTKNSGLPHNDVRTICFDNQGNKWIATFGGGLAKFDGANWTVYNTGNSGLPNNNIVSLAVDRSRTKWVGTYGSGVVRFSDTVCSVINVNNSEIPSNDIEVITIEAAGPLENKWMGALAVLCRLNEYGWKSFESINSIMPAFDVISICVDPWGNKWAGLAGGGMVEYNNDVLSIFNTGNSGIPSDIVYSIAVDSKGNKWIGTDNGLALYNSAGVVSIDKDNSHLPSQFSLMQNYPNPFNPSTIIRYKIPQTSNVNIKIYDLLGREIATLVNEEKAAGTYNVKFNAVNLPSGVYIYRISAGNFVQTKKMVYVK